MSSQEQNELQALTIWLHTFPVVQTAAGRRLTPRATRTPIDLANPTIVSAISEVAGEICGNDENDGSSTSSLQGHSGDRWESIFTLSQRRKGKKSHSLAEDTPHVWPHAVQHAALAALLDSAVGHPVIEQRKEYIERIMGLPPDVQRALMSLIERRKTSKTPKRTPRPNSHCGMPRGSRTSIGDSSPLTSSPRVVLSTSKKSNETLSTVASGGGEMRVSPRRSYDQAFPSTPDSIPAKRLSPGHKSIDTSFQSPGLGDTAAVEREFQTLREQTVQLRYELTQKENREMQLQDRLEQHEADFRQKLIKVEAEASRRLDDTCTDYQRQLARLNEQLTKVQDENHKATQALSQLAAVQDERDLLRHRQVQFDETLERLSTYREKVQHLADVKDALKREEDAHSKSVQECLRLRNELQNLLPLQRQLDEYKARATDAEVRLTETQDTLKRVQEEGLLNGNASNDMEKTCQTQQEEIRELRSRLHQETSAKGSDASSSVGDGLSELNPELKEEVFRLRDENARLQAFYDTRQDDAVTKRQEQLDDATRLCDRFKTQYLSTREQLEHKQRQLTASKSREAKFRSEVLESMGKLKETQAVVEDVSQQLHRAQEDLTTSRNKEAELEAELAKWIESAEELQEKNNTYTGELRSCTNKLEACQKREAKLIQDNCQLSEELLAEQKFHKETQKELSSTQDTVQSTESQVLDLRDQLDQWVAKAQKLEDRVATLNGHMDTGKSMLIQARAKEERLTTQVTQATQFLSEANNKCEELVNELSKVREQLSETKAELSASRDLEAQLTSDLSDVTQRAEDAETVSRHRKERVDSLRETLQSSQAHIESLEAKERVLQEEVMALAKRAEVAELKSQGLQSNLSETIRKLNMTQQSNDENQEKLLALAEQLSMKDKLVEDWKKQAVASTDEVQNLQRSLSQIQRSLADVQGDLQISQSNEETIGEDVQHAEQIILLLEDSMEQEVNHRRKLEEQLKLSQTEIARMHEDYEATTTQLSRQVDERSEQVEKFKQELFHVHENLNEVQSSLNGSEHREKMLQLEISRLDHSVSELQQELTSAKQAMERQAVESAQAVESTCQVIQAKAQMELEDLENRLNRLLEEERRAKRELEDSYQGQIRELKNIHKQKITELEALFQQSRDEKTHIKDIEIQTLRESYEEQLVQLKMVADEANTNLVAKGKGMLKDVKAKAREELESLRKELHELELRLAKEQEDNEKILVQAKTKLAGYKKKLELSSSRTTTLTNELDELESRIKSLEREKFKLSEENDRYRRQIGGRGGPDSKIQGQFEQLQKEFRSAIEENRELRRQLREKQDMNSVSGIGYLESIDEISDPSYSRNAMNQSTLVQLRAEYEETIEALNDEKRELVMKNSAAATDVQKAEKRAWESEKEISQLKQVNTSLQLHVERLKQISSSMEEDSFPPPPPPGPAPHFSKKSSRRSKKTVSIHESCTSTDDDAIELKTTLTDSSGVCYPAMMQGTDEVSVLSPVLVDNLNLPASCPPEGAITRTAAVKANGLPSFVQFPSPSPVQPEAPPECQQS